MASANDCKGKRETESEQVYVCVSECVHLRSKKEKCKRYWNIKREGNEHKGTERTIGNEIRASKKQR